MSRYAGTTQRRIDDAAAAKRLLARHYKDAHKTLEQSALWDNESTLAIAKAHMSYLFTGNAEKAAHSAHLDPSTKEFVKLVFARYCRDSERRLIDPVGAYGQQLDWYETISTSQRHSLEIALGAAVAEEARQLTFWGGLKPLVSKVVELIFQAYPTAEYDNDYYDPIVIAFNKAKESLSDEELTHTKSLRTAHNVARAKLQEAYTQVRPAA